MRGQRLYRQRAGFGEVAGSWEDGRNPMLFAPNQQTMSAQEIREKARLGDPEAIRMVLSYYLRSQGIEIRVQRQDTCLHILLQAERLLDQQKTTAFVEGLLSDLKVEAIDSAIIYGRQTGMSAIVWHQTILPESSGCLASRDDAEGVAVTLHRSTLEWSHEPAALMNQPSLEPIDPKIPRLPAQSSAEPPQDILKRPEAVLMIFFATLFLLWDAYLSFLEAESTTTLSTSELAQRLGTDRRTIRILKRQPHFSEWTRSLDPDGIAWTYQRGVYVMAPLASSPASIPQISPSAS